MAASTPKPSIADNNFLDCFMDWYSAIMIYTSALLTSNGGRFLDHEWVDIPAPREFLARTSRMPVVTRQRRIFFLCWVCSRQNRKFRASPTSVHGSSSKAFGCILAPGSLYSTKTRCRGGNQPRRSARRARTGGIIHTFFPT
ncbi:hypothetical protein B0H11DRAFT_2199109 [Mycena galericulata]|nr:hypothetical protein B0H11DRAFT_2199109 [Mycena galericulata]